MASSRRFSIDIASVRKKEILLKSDVGGCVLVTVERQVERAREDERRGLSGPAFAETAGLKADLHEVALPPWGVSPLG